MCESLVEYRSHLAKIREAIRKKKKKLFIVALLFSAFLILIYVSLLLICPVIPIQGTSVIAMNH